jgi:hypothetical protein
MKTRTLRRGSSEPGASDLVALVVVPSLALEQEVFRIGGGPDPYQCCSEANASGLDVSCEFSGVDQIEGRAVARRVGEELVIRWCTADASTKRVIDRGEVRRPLHDGAALRFVRSVPACQPAGVPQPAPPPTP